MACHLKHFFVHSYYTSDNNNYLFFCYVSPPCAQCKDLQLCYSVIRYFLKLFSFTN